MTEQIMVSENMIGSLNATRPWVKFLAILGFVFTGLAILGGLGMMAAFSLVPAKQGMPGFFGPVFGLIYILMGVFMYLIPCLYLLRYGQAIDGIPVSGQAALEQALDKQKSFWKYVGILSIVLIVLYVLVLLGVFAAIIFGAMHHA